LQICKIFATVIVGFFYTLSTVICAVSFVNKKSAPEIPSVKDVKRAAKKAVATATAPTKPYSPEILKTLIKASVVTGAVSIAATRSGNEFATPLQTIFLFCSTVAAYVFGARLPSEFTKVVHPLVTSTAITLGVIRIAAELTGSTFMGVLGQYKVGSIQWKSAGAGDVLLYLLGPAVVSFALSVYSRKKLLKENLLVVLTAMVVSGGGGLFGTAAFVRLVRIGGKGGGKVVRLSCLTRNVTTALAMAVTSMLGGDISIAASVVVFTGVFGATFGRSVMDAMGVKDPIARGLGLGCAAQGLGVSALIPEPEAFPFSAMGMILTAVFATTLVSVPAIKEMLINIATG
jgi:putative effector of murein hydrolase